MSRILTKIRDHEGKWIVHAELSEGETLTLVCADDPADEEAFFEDLRNYLSQSPEMMNYIPEDPSYPDDETEDF